MNRQFWRCAAIQVMILAAVMLSGVACRGEIPLVQVQGVEAAIDGNHVRMQGVVARYPDYDPLTERLTFWLDDGTGTVLVILSPDESRALLERDQVPTIGDRVSAVGTVRAGATNAWGDYVSLTVGKPAILAVKTPIPVESSIADVAGRALYSKVELQGRVSDVWRPYGGLTIVRIRDGTGEIDVVYGQDLVWIGGSPTTVLPGDAVSVRGAVTIHDGRVQIVLDESSGLRRLPALSLQPTPLHATVATLVPSATLTAGPLTATPGTLTTMRRPAPMVATSTVLAAPTETVAPALDVRGDSASGLEADAESGTDESQRLETGLLSETDLGKSVTVEGPIVRATLLSAGCKSVVDDGSGPAVVWMFDALYEQLVDPGGWNVGAIVRVTGRVNEYKGELEIVPQTPDAIVTVQRSFPAAVPDAVIGSLSTADLDRRVTVQGEIVAVDPFTAGIKCVLDDGSGQVTLLLWQNVFEALSDRDALAVGSLVRASGWVQEYRGDLEIVPGLTYDVAVLAGARKP